MPDLKSTLEYVVVEGQTASFDSSDFIADGYRGVLVFVLVNSVSTDDVTVKIQRKNPTTASDYEDLLTSAALSSTGLTVLAVYPGIAETANVSVSDVLSPVWRVSTTVSGGGSIDYDVAFAYIV